MKRFLILLFVVISTISVKAQTCYGHMTRNYYEYKKGEAVTYMMGKRGKIYLGDGAEYLLEAPSSYVKFSGYYWGEIVDPKNNYVNVRKGPGTNYAVVMRVYTYEWVVEHLDSDEINSVAVQAWFYFKKTKTNWIKLYSEPGKFLGYIYKDRIKYVTGREFF